MQHLFHSKKFLTLALPISDLRPTQFVAGMLEVEYKKIELDAIKKPKKMAKWLRKKIVPVVIGPGGAVYMIDRHHCVLAAWLSTNVLLKEKKVFCEVKEDMSSLSVDVFWARMISRNWVYLLRHGVGPLDPQSLPTHVKELEDDLFRSLAWIVREKKGFVKPYCVPFLEFVWADFLRANLCILKGEEGERPTFTTPTRSSVLTKRGKGSNKLYRHVQQHEVTMGDDGETAGEKVTVGPEELANMVELAMALCQRKEAAKLPGNRVGYSDIHIFDFIHRRQQQHQRQ